MDLSREYKTLLTSPLGENLIAELESRAKSLTDDARKAKSSDIAFGLLKESSGVMLAIEHLQFLAILPKDEGSQE